MREEIKSHAKSLGCLFVLGYREIATIKKDSCVLSASGTAAMIDLSDPSVNEEMAAMLAAVEDSSVSSPSSSSSSSSSSSTSSDETSSDTSSSSSSSVSDRRSADGVLNSESRSVDFEANGDVSLRRLLGRKASTPAMPIGSAGAWRGSTEDALLVGSHQPAGSHVRACAVRFSHIETILSFCDHR